MQGTDIKWPLSNNEWMKLCKEITVQRVSRELTVVAKIWLVCAGSNKSSIIDQNQSLWRLGSLAQVWGKIWAATMANPSEDLHPVITHSPLSLSWELSLIFLSHLRKPALQWVSLGPADDKPSMDIVPPGAQLERPILRVGKWSNAQVIFSTLATQVTTNLWHSAWLSGG